MKNIMIIGSFSGGNFGDSFILYSIINEFNRKFNDANFIIPTPRPSYVEGLFGSDVNIETVNISMKKKLTFRFFGYNTIKKLKKTDIIFTTAGILFDMRFYDPRFNFVSSLLPLFSIARKKNIKIIGLGVGITPFTSFFGKLLLTKVLEQHNYIATRDKTSFDFLKKNDISTKCNQFSDIGHLIFENDYYNKYDNNSKCIGFNFASYGNKQYSKKEELIIDEEYLNKIIEFIDSMVKIYRTKPVFIATNKSDYEFHKKLISHMSLNVKNILLFSNDIVDELDKIPNLKLFFGSRLHSNIIISNLKIPVIGLAYHIKTEDYIHSIYKNKNKVLKFSNLTSLETKEKIETFYYNTDDLHNELTIGINNQISKARKLVNDVFKKIESYS